MRSQSYVHRCVKHWDVSWIFQTVVVSISRSKAEKGSMRFWQAVAIQLLAITLKDTPKVCLSDHDSCTPVEVSCLCNHTTENPVVTDLPVTFVASSTFFAGLVIGSLGYRLWCGWRQKVSKHERSVRGRIRRRGGGVISSADSGESDPAVVQ